MVSSNLIKLLYADFPSVKMIRLTLQQCYIPVLLQEKAGNERQLQTQSGSRAVWTTAHVSNLICDSGRSRGVFNNDQAEFSQWVGLRRVILSVLKVLWARMKQMQLNKLLLIQRNKLLWLWNVFLLFSFVLLGQTFHRNLYRRFHVCWKKTSAGCCRLIDRISEWASMRRKEAKFKVQFGYQDVN